MLSSELPSSSNRFRPFSSLPPELVQSILESTVPHSFHSTTYESRQATLRSLCLVSKLFYQIAKPLLLTVIHVERNDDETALCTRRDILKKSTKEAIFKTTPWRVASYAVAKLRLFAPLLPGLERLAIDHIENVKLSEICHSYTKLTSLRLVGVTFDIDNSSSFDNLEDLTIYWCKGFNPEELLNRNLFPKISALSFHSDNSGWRNPDLKPFNSSNPLLENLDILALNGELVDGMDQAFIESIEHFLLVECSFENYDRHLHCSPRYIRITPEILEIRTDKLGEMLEKIEGQFEYRETSLLTLWLPQKWISGEYEGDHLEWQRKKLFSEAEYGPCDVVGEIKGDHWKFDPIFPPGFQQRRTPIAPTEDEDEESGGDEDEDQSSEEDEGWL